VLSDEDENENENESDVVGIELHRRAAGGTACLSSMPPMLAMVSEVRTLPPPSLDVDWQDCYSNGITISPFPVTLAPYSSTNP
jgi:hypothetical protein